MKSGPGNRERLPLDEDAGNHNIFCAVASERIPAVGLPDVAVAFLHEKLVVILG